MATAAIYAGIPPGDFESMTPWLSNAVMEAAAEIRDHEREGEALVIEAMMKLISEGFQAVIKQIGALTQLLARGGIR
jgi:hypothetical protein